MTWVWDPETWTMVEKLVAHVEPMLAELLFSGRSFSDESREKVLQLMQRIRDNRAALDGRLEFERQNPNYANRHDVFDLYASIETAAMHACGMWLLYKEAEPKDPQASKDLVFGLWGQLEEAASAILSLRENTEKFKFHRLSLGEGVARLEGRGREAVRRAFAPDDEERADAFWTRFDTARGRLKDASRILHGLNVGSAPEPPSAEG